MLERLNEMGFIESSAFFVIGLIALVIIIYAIVGGVILAWESFGSLFRNLKEIMVEFEENKKQQEKELQKAYNNLKDDKPITETILLNNTRRIEILEREQEGLRKDVDTLVEVFDKWHDSTNENIRELDEYNDVVEMELNKLKKELDNHKTYLSTLYNLSMFILRQGGKKDDLDGCNNEPSKSKDKKE